MYRSTIIMLNKCRRKQQSHLAMMPHTLRILLVNPTQSSGSTIRKAESSSWVYNICIWLTYRPKLGRRCCDAAAVYIRTDGGMYSHHLFSESCMHPSISIVMTDGKRKQQTSRMPRVKHLLHLSTPWRLPGMYYYYITQHNKRLDTWVIMYGHTTYSKSMDQSGKKVANPAGGQLKKENTYFLVRVRA